jgi:transcriptional regulator with GAF, ATPase, and Fis domain
LENCLLRAFLLSPEKILEFGDTPTTDTAPQEKAPQETILQETIPQETDIDFIYMETTPAAIHDPEKIQPMSFQDAKAIVITRFEAHYLQQVMRIAQGNVSAAARIAGKERRALGKLLQKYSIDKTQFQSLKSSFPKTLQG